MTVSSGTLARMRRAALGAAVVAASGLSLAAVTSAQAQEPGDVATPTAVISEESGPEPTLEPEEAPVVVTVLEPAPPIDGDDCPGCGLG